jgi:hypothetical protein
MPKQLVCGLTPQEWREVFASNRQRLSPQLSVSPKTAAAMCDLGVRTLARIRNQRTGPKYIRIGRAVRYRVIDLHEWLAEVSLRAMEGGPSWEELRDA